MKKQNLVPNLKNQHSRTLMKKDKRLYFIFSTLLLLLAGIVVKGQSSKNKLSNQAIWIELDCLVNPIYISQFSGQYKLNGKKLHINPKPRFYAVQPGQVPFSSFNEILDQSNAGYLNIRLKRLERSRFSLLRNTRLIVGITHHKLQTGSDTVHYKYDDGGTELTFMLDKNLTEEISKLNFDKIGLVFSVNMQVGFFLSVAKIRTEIRVPGQTILSTNTKRWQLPNPNTGWGMMASANLEIGKIFGRFAFTVGSKLMMEGLYSSDKVTVNDVPGYTLKVSNYGIFFSGPVLNLKYLIH